MGTDHSILSLVSCLLPIMKAGPVAPLPAEFGEVRFLGFGHSNGVWQKPCEIYHDLAFLHSRLPAGFLQCAFQGFGFGTFACFLCSVRLSMSLGEP